MYHQNTQTVSVCRCATTAAVVLGGNGCIESLLIQLLGMEAFIFVVLPCRERGGLLTYIQASVALNRLSSHC